MKKFLIFVLVTMAHTVAFAITPTTSCPTGYIAIEEEYITITDTSCSSVRTEIGTTTSCLVGNPADSCIMYAPANTEYTDASGTYEYTAACPLE